MRIMKNYDYDDLSSLLRNNRELWIKTSKREMRFYLDGEEIGLPRIRGYRLDACQKYANINPNFAYEYNRLTDLITVWDRRVEEYEDISAAAFQEVDTCGMGLMAYNKYADNITGQVPTFKMRDAAENIFCDAMEYFHN